MSGGAPLRLNKYITRTMFNGILGYLSYTYKKMLNIMMFSSTCVKLTKHKTLTWLESLIHHGLMYWTKL